jgi:hypothetical protein
MYDDAKYEEVVSGVRSIASGPSVAEVRDHFAGYFDELGLWVRFLEGTPDNDVIELRNELVAYLNSVLPEGNPLFSWGLSIERGRDTLDVIAPGEGPLERNGKLAPIK